MKRSQDMVSSWARAIGMSGIAWPNEMVAVFEVGRLVAGPEAARRAGVRNSRLRRDARAGEGDDAPGRTDQFPQQLDIVHKPSCHPITAPASPDCAPRSR